MKWPKKQLALGIEIKRKNIKAKRIELFLRYNCSPDMPFYPHAFLKKGRGYFNRVCPSSVRPSVRYAISS